MNNRRLGEKLQSFWDILFPRRCVVCDGLLESEFAAGRIHPLCQRKLYPVEGVVCLSCGRPMEGEGREYCYDCGRNSKRLIRQGKSLFLYKGAVKKAMYRFKYCNRQEYGVFFAEYTEDRLGSWIAEKKIEAILPVPMYRKKQRQRGYNQAEVFAKALSQKTGIPVVANMVERITDTTPQKELNDVERKKNLKNAFQIRENIVQYKNILVVDDIYTTGSTAEAVAGEVIKTGDTRVYFLSICIGAGL